jgi:formate-nitrite transporter family protein
MASDLNAQSPSAPEGAKKAGSEILEQEIHEGLSAFERPLPGLLLSALAAGLDVSFSLLLMGVMWTLGQGAFPEPVIQILVANMYAVGFIFVVLGRSELFTEHTTLAVLPFLRGHVTFGELLRLWAIVYVGNLLGAAAFAWLTTIIGPALGVIDPRAFVALGRPLVLHPWWVILLSGLLAGWMMGLLSWLVAAGRDTISQIVIVWLITTGIGLAHLHHSVVGTGEVLSAVFVSDQVSVADFGNALLWTTLGNALGGTVFVSLLRYSFVDRVSLEAMAWDQPARKASKSNKASRRA